MIDHDYDEPTDPGEYWLRRKRTNEKYYARRSEDGTWFVADMRMTGPMLWQDFARYFDRVERLIPPCWEQQQVIR